MNKRIRIYLSRYVSQNGPIDSRRLIARAAKRFGTSKQRICGNLSFMICRAHTLTLVGPKPSLVA